MLGLGLCATPARHNYSGRVLVSAKGAHDLAVASTAGAMAVAAAAQLRQATVTQPKGMAPTKSGCGVVWTTCAGCLTQLQLRAFAAVGAAANSTARCIRGPLHPTRKLHA